ncbi:hypothetical protein C8256_00390 [Kluyvera genomosp. 2]|uniref:Uncharacterized protein n=1 Tax=Kluyvera genomosp. 2 TaxID=2774054 RepID=A0A2T2Y7S2_9ENTR|nr:hypothetical protein C8256_00390 [Kluyvera genomosp. 2]
MLPITFFATAFGLMMEKVRSIAMITSNNKIYFVVVHTAAVLPGADYNDRMRRCLWMKVTFF